MNRGDFLKEDQWKKTFLQYLIIELLYSELTIKAYDEDISDFHDFFAETGEASFLAV